MDARQRAAQATNTITRARADERRQRVAELVALGWHTERIALCLGWDRSTIRRDRARLRAACP